MRNIREVWISFRNFAGKERYVFCIPEFHPLLVEEGCLKGGVVIQKN
jgi:hypothetical protein